MSEIFKVTENDQTKINPENEDIDRQSVHSSLGKFTKEDFIGNGAAGSARVSAASDGVINGDKSNIGKSFVKNEFKDIVKSDIIINPHDKLKNGIASTVGSIAAQNIERSLTSENDGSLSDKTRAKTIKHGLHSGAKTFVATGAAIKGTYRYGRYIHRVSKDAINGTLTKAEASLSILKRGGTSIKAAGSSINSTIKKSAIRAVEDFHGSDDLGIQAITKPKDAIVTAKRTVRTVKAAGRSTRNAVQKTRETGRKIGNTAKNSIKSIQKAARKTQQAAAVIKSATSRIAANLLAKKAAASMILPVGIVLLLTIPVLVVVSIFPVITLKSEDWELTQTFSYITELDARMELKIIEEATKPHFHHIEEYHYYLNGVELSKESLIVYTNADFLLKYFDAKYEDYTFNGLIAGFFGGTKVKDEIDHIHALLHQLNISERSVIVDVPSISYDFWGNPVAGTTQETQYHIDIKLTTQSIEDYFNANWDTLMTPEEKEKMDIMDEVGLYTTRKELGTPFIGINWISGVTSRFGYRIHPITGVLDTHNALDIGMPGGTPINACMPGTVEVPPFMSDGYGNYVKIINANSDYTLYAHMVSIAVVSGQQVNTGDVIGYVGTTGKSNGNHLHIEYKKDGHMLNPIFYIAEN